MKDCVVCLRLHLKVVFEYAHMVFRNFSREDIHHLARDAYECINFVDEKSRAFWIT